MSEEQNEFETLCSLNVNDKTEKKNNLTYLSWAWAWQTFVKVYPQAKYEVVKNENMMPYFKDESGAFCYTRVTAGSITHEMWLPVMDYKNQPIKNPNAFEINKTLMRCLTKNLAMFGLGLYIYAGEDLPEGEEAPQKAPVPSKASDSDKKQLWAKFKARCKEIDPMELLTRDGVDMGDKDAVYSVTRKYMALDDTMFDGVLDSFRFQDDAQ